MTQTKPPPENPGRFKLQHVMTLEPQSETKVAEAVRLILTDLASSALNVGAVLDREADLVQRYHIGRSTFREAVRILEADGLMRMQQGRHGGLVVEATPLAVGRRLIESAMYQNRVSVLDVWNAESILMAEAAELAAQNITTQDIMPLRLHVHAQLSSFPSPAKALENRVLLRTIIARISNNSLVQALLPTLTRLGLAQVPTDWLGLEANAKGIAASLKREQALIEAIISGDVSLARQQVMGLLEFDQAGISVAVGEKSIAATLTAGASRQLPETGRSQVYMVTRKLEEQIAAHPVKTRIGTEEIIAEQFGVGRNMIRQALRLLEYRGIVVLRRGKGGGFFKGTTSFDRAAEMVRTYFLSSGIRPDDAIPIARAFDLAAAPAAARMEKAEGHGEKLLRVGLTHADLSNWLAEQSGNAVGMFIGHLLSRLRPDGDRPIQPIVAGRLSRAIATHDAGVTRRIVLELHRPRS